MRRLCLCLVLLAGWRFCAAAPASEARSPFEGVWVGEIIGPDTRTSFGLAFTATEKGLLVSLHWPEMFLYSANFGPAAISGDTFQLDALNLRLTRAGDTLTGVVALAPLPVELHRGGTFSDAPPAPALPAAPAPRWTRALGADAWATPVARDGILYLGTLDGKFHALRAIDGEPVWTWNGPAPLYGEALATEDALYFVDARTDLVCLARASGELRWRTPLHNASLAGRPAPDNETFNHRTASPVIDPKGVLYVGSTDGGLYAVRAANGRVLWRHDARAPIYAPVALRGTDELVAAAFDGSVFTLNRRSRQETARVKLGGPLVAAPVLAGQRVIVGSRDYLLYGLDAKKSSVAWRKAFWFSWVESTPRVADGLLYIGGSDFRRVSALQPADGRVLWATDVLGLSWGSPVVTRDTVFAGTAGQNIEGTVIQHTGGLIALDRATGAVRWRYVSPAPAGRAFTGFAGSLVLSGEQIIGVQTDGTLLAFPAGVIAD